MSIASRFYNRRLAQTPKFKKGDVAVLNNPSAQSHGQIIRVVYDGIVDKHNRITYEVEFVKPPSYATGPSFQLQEDYMLPLNSQNQAFEVGDRVETLIDVQRSFYPNVPKGQIGTISNLNVQVGTDKKIEVEFGNTTMWYLPSELKMIAKHGDTRFDIPKKIRMHDYVVLKNKNDRNANKIGQVIAIDEKMREVRVEFQGDKYIEWYGFGEVELVTDKVKQLEKQLNLQPLPSNPPTQQAPQQPQIPQQPLKTRLNDVLKRLQFNPTDKQLKKQYEDLLIEQQESEISDLSKSFARRKK